MGTKQTHEPVSRSYEKLASSDQVTATWNEKNTDRNLREKNKIY